MSWSFKCCECGNNNRMLFKFINHREHTSVKKLKCLVCNEILKHLDYGVTELDEESESDGDKV